MFPESHDRLGRSRKHETDVDITLTQDHNIAGRSLSFVWSLRSVGDLFPDAHAKVMPGPCCTPGMADWDWTDGLEGVWTLESCRHGAV